ncbi:unnamed protein product [Discula destructiva]
MQDHRSSEWQAAGPAFAFILFLMLALLTVGGSAIERDQALICASENSKDCYPMVFQATDEFQTIREEQEIPHGLHVRLDVTTGKKEAKLNNPDDDNLALEGLPVASSIVIAQSEEGSEEVLAVPKGAPAYEPVGKIKAPPTENQAFYDSLTVLKTLSLNDRPVDAALSILKDIAHDIYYGLKVAEDANAVKELLCMMSSQDLFAKDTDNLAVLQAGDAAYIIGSALQNNQKALDEIEKSWPDISKAKCANSDRTLGYAVFNSLLPDVPISGGSSQTEGRKLSLTKAKSSALRGLIKSPLIRGDFLSNGGMAQILQVLTLERPELVSDQQKLANLVMDNFLDEDMGATLGEWPRAGDLDHDWDYKLKDLAKLHKSDAEHWSAELWKRLQIQRKASRAVHEASKQEL